MYKNILVAVDGSEHATHAIRSAVGVAHGKEGATIYLLTVDGCRPLKGSLAELAKIEDLSRDEIFGRILESALHKAKAPDGVELVTMLRIGNPADIILDEAQKINADLIVVGRRGVGVYAELLLGSVSRKVLHLAKVPVMVVNV